MNGPSGQSAAAPRVKPDTPRRSRCGVVRRLLTGRRLAVLSVLIGVGLTLPSLGVGWVADDYSHRLKLSGLSRFDQFGSHDLDLFKFFDGDLARNLALLDGGFVPWWTNLAARAAFWRPLSSLTHWVDYQLWPERPALMHAHSIAWFAAVLAAVAALYRRILGRSALAGLAALLYALDDARATPVAFLANRNALVALLFGTGALIAHDAWRRTGVRGARPAALVCFALSLLGGESGVGTGAYLLAYGLCLDCGPMRRRLMSLVPYVAIGAVWRAVWGWLGYGVAGVGLYIDPLTEPGRFAAAALWRAPLLLLGQLGLPPSEVSILLDDAGAARLIAAAVAAIALLGAVMYPMLRRDAVARFFALGMLLSIVPICATFPSDRLLTFAGIGGSGLVACFLSFAMDSRVATEPGARGVNGAPAPAGRTVGRAWRWPARVAGAALGLVHLVAAPPYLAFRSAYPIGSPETMRRMHVQVPMDASVERQTVVVVNTPLSLFVGTCPVIKAFEGQPVPQRMLLLGASSVDVDLARPDERTVVVRPAGGFLKFTFDEVFRSPAAPIPPGYRLELTACTVEVTAMTADGRPAEAAFRFKVPLDDASLRWLAWQNDAYAPFLPPPVGGTVRVRFVPPRILF